MVKVKYLIIYARLDQVPQLNITRSNKDSLILYGSVYWVGVLITKLYSYLGMIFGTGPFFGHLRYCRTLISKKDWIEQPIVHEL